MVTVTPSSEVGSLPLMISVREFQVRLSGARLVPKILVQEPA
jgi:hypothetical protein